MTQDTMGKVVPYNPAKHEGFVLESWVRTWARARAGVRMGVDQDGPAGVRSGSSTGPCVDAPANGARERHGGHGDAWRYLGLDGAEP